VNIREVLNGVFYVLMTGCQWRALPKDLPPKSTVHEYLGLWEWDGTLARIHHALFVEVPANESYRSHEGLIPGSHENPVTDRMNPGLWSAVFQASQHASITSSTVSKMRRWK
jgi:hypothetical protein